MTDVPPWEDPRRPLARHGLWAKKRFSQNFLTSRAVVERIVEALAPAPGEHVVELGSGVGTLTGALLRKQARVFAVEADRDMLTVLQSELGHIERLTLLHGDAARIQLAALPGVATPVAVVGNLPYAITGAIFRRLVDQHRLVARAVLMVQREVRDRLLAAPATKDFGALTVFTRAVFDVRSVCVVPAGAFHPAPRVESAVIALSPRAEPIDPTRPAFSAAVRLAFEARRKTLRNALLRGFSAQAVERALGRAAIAGTRRGETLSSEEFHALALALEAANET